TDRNAGEQAKGDRDKKSDSGGHECLPGVVEDRPTPLPSGLEDGGGRRQQELLDAEDANYDLPQHEQQDDHHPGQDTPLHLSPQQKGLAAPTWRIVDQTARAHVKSLFHAALDRAELMCSRSSCTSATE